MSPPGAVRTLFLGSGAFGVPILEALADAPGMEVVAVVSVPDRPVGRRGELTPVPVAARAREMGLPLHQPTGIREPELLVALAALAPGLGVLADFGRIVPRALLDMPRHGFLNLHPSLLPRHRGAAPVPATILAGDREAGVTLMLMDEGLDTGPIVASERWPLVGTETAPDLEASAAAAAARLLRASLPGWLDGSIVPRPQPETGATLTRPLRREDGALEPGRGVDLLERQVRAYQPWPGSFLESVAGRLLVWRATAAGGPAEGQVPGTLVPNGSGLALVAADGLLELDEVQLAGRRRMRGDELRRGHPELVGSRVR